MIGSLKRAYESFRGIGDASLAIPPLDGVYRPNQALEQAELVAQVSEPDNLVAIGDQVHVTSGRERFAILPGGATDKVRDYSGTVTALSTVGGVLVAAVRGQGILIEGGPHDGKAIAVPGEADITALAFRGDGTILATVGSKQHNTDHWTRDLLEIGSSGQVLSIEMSSGKITVLADGLRYPNGVVEGPDGSVWVSECWANRVIGIDRNGRRSVLLGNLPGYPSRIATSPDGGCWLAIAAPRNQLLEFVLREPDYRDDIVATIEPKNWIAPSYSAPDSFLQPMQQGGQRVMGILKPWAPSLSYGLVVRLDGSGRPVRSFHSRADGRRHGVTSVLQAGNRLIFVSRGAGQVASIQLDR